jgi:uncharacterized protein (DUF433 family)
MVELARRISIDGEVPNPVIRGTQVSVDLLVGEVASGLTVDDVARAHGVEPEDVLAAIAYATRAIADEQARLAC